MGVSYVDEGQLIYIPSACACVDGCAVCVGGCGCEEGQVYAYGHISIRTFIHTYMEFPTPNVVSYV